MLALFLCRLGSNKALLLYSAGTKVAVSAHGMHFESMIALSPVLKYKKQRFVYLFLPVMTCVVCSSCMLRFLGRLYCKQCGPRSECSKGGYLKQT